MSLTRKMLKSMELDEDKISQIIEAHSSVIDEIAKERDAFKADVEKYKAEAERLSSVEKDLVKAQGKLEDAEKVSEKLKALQAEFEGYKADVNAKATQATKEKAYKELLREAGVSEKRFDSIVKVSDLSGLEVDADGKVKDTKAVLAGIKSEWADFIVKETEHGARTPAPPTNTGGGEMSKEDIMKIKDTSERQNAIRDYANTHGGW